MSKVLIFVLLIPLFIFSFPAGAESGWILVVPPRIQQMTDAEIDWLNKSTAAQEAPVDRTLYHGDAILDKAAPIAEWRQISVFESITSCEADRNLRLRASERELDNIRDLVGAGQKLSLEEVNTLFAISLGKNARCVPASAYYGN